MRKVLALTIVFGLAVLLIAGVYQVFRLRFQAGDVYPEYSTLRADPLGAKAAYDTVRELGDYSQVIRYQQDLRLLKSGADTTLFFAGATGEWFDHVLTRSEFQSVNAALERGARVVVTLSGRDNAFGDDIEVEEGGGQETLTPDEVLDRESRPDGKRDDGTSDESGDEETSDDGSADRPQLGFGEVKSTWDFAVGYASNEDWDLEDGIEAKIETDSVLLSEGITIRSPWRFARLGPEWNVVATVEGRPVVIERVYGKGRIVLSADSWFLSNEALAKHRKLGELIWAAGDRPVVIFDETHHGVQTSEGVVGMASRYSLHGVLPGLGILFLLVLWRGNSSLVPGTASLDLGVGESVTVDGIDSESGVVRLMRTGIPGNEILRECYLAWARNPILRRKFSKAQVEAVRDRVVAEESKAAGQRSFVNAYREIVKSLSRRR